MAQDQQSEKSTSGIEHAKKNKWGYDPRQVDEFLEKAHAQYEAEGLNLTQGEIQNVSFDLSKGGYVISQVDATLERLERAVVDKQTSYEIAQSGRVAWKAQTEELFRQVRDHAKRAEGQRFAPGKGKNPSYDRKQVDRLIDGIITRAQVDLDELPEGEELTAERSKELDNITSSSVANTVFTQRKGKHGYDERQVDYYLNSCVELLSRLESYERIADYVNSDAADRIAIVNSAQGTNSLFSSAQPSTVAAAAAGAVQSVKTEPTENFDELQKAEQAMYETSLHTSDEGTNVYETASLVSHMPQEAAATTTAAAGTASAATQTPNTSGTSASVQAPSAFETATETETVSVGETTAAWNPLEDMEENAVPPSFMPAETSHTSRGARHAAHAEHAAGSHAAQADNSQPRIIAEAEEVSVTAPAQSTASVLPQDAMNDHIHGHQSDSLSALAHMVQATQVSAQEAANIPDLPVNHHHDGDQGQKPGEQTSNISFRSLNPQSESIHIEIPDLSFPTFDDDSEGKSQQ